MRAVSDEQAAASAGEIAACRLFRGLDDQQRATVLEYAEVLEVEPGETIVEEGGTGTELYVLLAGAADVSVRLDGGHSLDVATLRAGDSFGELAALLRERRAATIVAAEPCRILRVGEADLVTLLERVGPLGLALSRELARELHQALGQRNELQLEATPERHLDASDGSGTRAYVARYYLATARNVARRQRLLSGDRRTVYTADVRVTPEDAQRWDELFGTSPDQPAVPFTYHVTAWTVLLLQLAEDLGINFRNLSHHSSSLTFHPDGRYLTFDVDHHLQVRTDVVLPLEGGRVGLVVDTQLTASDGTRLLAGTDTFSVDHVDRAVLKQLRSEQSAPSHPGSDFGSMVDRHPELADGSKGLHQFGLALADDLGIRYGRLSGNLSPVHTSSTGARLLGHDRPFLQHLCLVNLVLRHITATMRTAPTRVELAFVRPVHAGTTVQIRFDDSRHEIVDEEGRLLVAGEHVLQGSSAPRADETSASALAAERSDALEQTERARDRSRQADRPEPAPVAAPLDFEPAQMQRLLDGEQAELRQRVRKLLSSPTFVRDPDLPRDALRDKVLSWCQALAADGLGALAFPRAVGGADDPAAAIAVFETLAEHDMSLVVKFGVQFGLFGGAILRLGTERHHERYLHDVGTLELPGCFALTELGHGSDARGIRTRASYDPATHEYVISTPDDDARKDYIGNAARHGRLAVVFAQLDVAGQDEGVHAFLVPIRDHRGETLPGVRIEDCGAKIGLNGVDNGRLWFDDVRVPWDALLDRYGHVSIDGVYSSPLAAPSARFFTMLSTLVQGRISVGLAGVSAARSALTIAIRYADARRQFGPPGEPETPLLDYRTHQRRLLVPLATTYALHFALREVVDDYLGVLRSDDAAPRARMQLETVAAGLKALATWHASATIQECREACGGAGYLWENRFGALRADTDIFTTFEGDNTVLLQLVTKMLLTDYKQQFDDMDLRALVRFLMGQVVSAIVPTPASRRSDETHLRDRTFHLDAFRTREDLLLSQLARRLKRTLGEGVDPHRAFIRHQPEVVRTAQAHGERVVLERFAAAIERCPDTGVVPVLERLCDLYALSHLERHRGWYLEQGLFAGTKTRAISGEVDRLCGDLRPHAIELVDSFGIPEVLLDAPLAAKGAFSDGCGG